MKTYRIHIEELDSADSTKAYEHSSFRVETDDINAVVAKLLNTKPRKERKPRADKGQARTEGAK